MTSFKLATWSLSLACLLAGPAFAGETGTPSPGHEEVSPGAQGSGPFSAAQLAEMQARMELANAIAQNVAADAQAKGLADSWRVNLISSLLNTPSVSLRNVAATASTLDQAHAQVLAAASVPPSSDTASGTRSLESLGSTSDSLVYTPMTPCRFADTRGTTAGRLTSTPRIYNTALDGNSFGGLSTCIIPSTLGALAIAANITLVDPEGGLGFLGVRPAGSTLVTSFLNWFQTGGTVAIANAGIISTSQDNASTPYRFEMYVKGNALGISAHAIVDYFGYFAAAATDVQALDCRDFNVNSHPILANQVDSVAASCAAIGPQYSLTGGGCDTSSSTVYVLSSRVTEGDSNSWTCRYSNTGGTQALIAAHVKCCAVPAR